MKEQNLAVLEAANFKNFQFLRPRDFLKENLKVLQNDLFKLLLKKGHEDYNFSIPVQVILGENKVPVLLGREKFFDEFTIIFDQTNERILLKKANNKI